MSYTFLSDDWFTQLDKLHPEAPEPPPAIKNLTINLVIEGGPEGEKEAHLTGGHFQKGLANEAPTTLRVPFDIAKSMFIEGNQQAAMQAFMSGKIKVEGDMSKLMAMQAAGAPSAEQQAFQEKLKDLTA